MTGANKGIGRAVAAGLAARGMVVLLAARDPERGRTAARELGVAWVHLDVTEPATIEAAVRQVEREHGRLDVLVNNAGISGHVPGRPPGETPVEAVREVFETNVLGVVAVTNAFLPLLRRSRAARIVNVSSAVGSLTCQTDPGHYLSRLPPAAAYPASKAALNALTVQYARELEPEGILVNAATPGACATDFTRGLNLPIPRTAQDGARAIVGLATLPDGGPTGGFYDESGTVPW
ncbi:MAG: SDR family NAD(P)-dependent oxidoreductase [Nonomuraea sp.]|nr:SDR family NAD(P)-dependent oxidoreductase [Nonomuraea sp.]